MTGQLLRRLIPAGWRPVRYLETLTWTRSGGRVQAGPFAGLRYRFGSVGSAFIPKLLGIYERELYPIVERAIAAAPARVIDIGAAEGYYAIGLAVRCPSAEVVAYEMEENGRQALSEMAAANGVTDRVAIRGKCELEDLARDLDMRPTLIVCDCEGYEGVLLDPTRVPGLATASVLVELHDFITPGLGEELTSRFASTHAIERVWQTERSVADFPYHTLYTRCLPRSFVEWAVSEWRPERMSWLWMVPKV